MAAHSKTTARRPSARGTTAKGTTAARRPPMRGKTAKGTFVNSRRGNVNYYREGRNRSLKVKGYTAAKHQGEYVLATPGGKQVSGRPPAKSYHRFILAEFIGCLAMVGAAMILVPVQGATESASTAGRSFAKELVQLTALCIVFFALALMASGGKTGKVAAAFGGLVTLGVAWNLSAVFSALAKALGVTVTASASTAQVTPAAVATNPLTGNPG